MKRYLIGRIDDGRFTRAQLRAMFELRHEVFSEKLKWDVESRNGCETDDYDTLDPHYLMMMEAFDVIGCARLLPTEGRYMLGEVFRPLLRGEEVPRSGEVWELSRFAMRSLRRRYARAAVLAEDTLAMFREMVRFADARGIGQYVAVINTAYERLLRRNGIPLERFGDGGTTWLGDIETVACRIPIDVAMRQAIELVPAPRPSIERIPVLESA